LLQNSRGETSPIDETISCLIDFGWLSKCQEQDAPELREIKTDFEALKYQPLTYDEFKITRASMLDTLEINVMFLKPKLTPFACEKAKYNAV
jgi:hypothetical protein